MEVQDPKELLYTADTIRTFSGAYIDVFFPDPSQIIIGDIAWGLSHTARFGGHTKGFLSVAQHSCQVADMVPPEYQLCALLHDASEAYIGDIPAPIKKKLPHYKAMENSLMMTIAEVFGFQWPMPSIIKQADRVQLENEFDACMMDNRPYQYWSPEFARYQFMEYFKKFKSQ